jgi:hypothetical protein
MDDAKPRVCDRGTCRNELSPVQRAHYLIRYSARSEVADATREQTIAQQVEEIARMVDLLAMRCQGASPVRQQHFSTAESRFKASIPGRNTSVTSSGA